ncbi:hypothetical protein FP026_04700 [Rhizobium tropici]|uniref:DUF4345 domain-containing protein n=1 Tax=Rhizobium tropici TaxID=398 RepID=A0A5B0WCT6_RHITR|nr:hypothetical protein [Rhizobium tropici]KAA1184676.1 hypothetical protein FP026_04700 [Rhizobium tropici]
MLTALYTVTIINVLGAAFFAIAGLVRPTLVAPGSQTESSRIFALYTLARTIPIAVVTIAAGVWAPLIAMLWLSALSALLQLLDGYVGTQLRNARTTWGPIFLGVVQSALLAWVVFNIS